jgi:alginate O-acetyltransferase complex protein AlgI
MLFNSISFLIFFTIVTSLYFVLPHKFRWSLLLMSSCYFYMSFVPVYILILGFTIIIDYLAGLMIERAKGKKRLFFLICSLVANIGILAIFKYYNFIVYNLSFLFKYTGSNNPFSYLSILLPIGLSFHTFQAMSYTLEVYRGKQKAEKHFGIYALYVMFYPQLVAGPIERPQNLLHQFYEKHSFDYVRITDGLKLMAWGLFKKVVIADRLSILVDNVYNNPYHHHGLSFIIATVCFSFQIFCDFSGYSDMAIGIAKVMGFRLMKNFNSPYHAKSVSEFWTRWHISLSTWFKDYLYIPLGGSRVSVPRLYLNLFIVFLISGLWHGASWTFMAWGALHGFYLIFSLATKKYKNKISRNIGLQNHPKFNRLLQMFVTFLLVSFAWIFFRAKSISVAFYIIKSMVTYTSADIYGLLQHQQSHLDLGLIGKEIWIALFSVIFLEAIHIIQMKHSITAWIRTKPVYMRWAVYYTFLFLILLFNVSDSKQFIYFQF